MYLSYEQVAAAATVKTATDLTIPAKATHAELQADTYDIRYTMDNTTDPTSTSGMLLVASAEPKLFLIEDLKRIRFIQVLAGAGNLNIHYLAGRDV